MNYKYTFFVPAYKTEYFEVALRSIVEQTFRDFMVIVSDDCSPMPLYTIFEKVKSDYKHVLKDGQLVYKRNEKNIGGANLVQHWNSLLDSCDSDYLIMASDDDIYAPSFLEEIDRLTSRYPNCNLYCSKVKRINENGVVTAQDAPTFEFEKQIDFLYGLYVLHRLKCIGNYVFKTKPLKDKGGFLDFPYAWGSDDLTVSLMSDKGIGITKDNLFSFRLSGKNISSKNNSVVNSQKIKARMLNLEYFETFVHNITTNGSLLEKNRLASYMDFYRKEWTHSILVGVEFMSYREMKDCYKWLEHHQAFNGSLSKIHFVWTWLKAIKTRKLQWKKV